MNGQKCRDVSYILLLDLQKIVALEFVANIFRQKRFNWLSLSAEIRSRCPPLTAKIKSNSERTTSKLEVLRARNVCS